MENMMACTFDVAKACFIKCNMNMIRESILRTDTIDLLFYLTYEYHNSASRCKTCKLFIDYNIFYTLYRL